VPEADHHFERRAARSPPRATGSATTCSGSRARCSSADVAQTSGSRCARAPA